MSTEEWSVLWEGVAAVGTMGAVVWAVYTTLAERRKRTDAEKELTAEKASSRIAKRREQADHVAIWFEIHFRNHEISGDITANGSVLVGNYSGAPIFNAVVTGEAWLAQEAFSLGDARVVPPGTEPWSSELVIPVEQVGELQVRVEFQDVAGLWWRRTSEGRLEEITPQT